MYDKIKIVSKCIQSLMYHSDFISVKDIQEAVADINLCIKRI